MFIDISGFDNVKRYLYFFRFTHIESEQYYTNLIFLNDHYDII